MALSNPRIVGNLRADRGFALISVLWILVLLTAIVGEFAYSMRTEVNISRNFKEATQAHYIAHSGLMYSIISLLEKSAQEGTPAYTSPDEEITNVRINAHNQDIEFGSGRFLVHIDNTSGLIDINSANEGLLHLMTNVMDVADQERDIIVDSILDWRDEDDFHRMNGAENKYYQSLPVPYGCKNAPFESIDELVLVRGMSRELLTDELRSILTIIPEGRQNGRGSGGSPHRSPSNSPDRININAAPLTLLGALPGVTPQHIEDLADYRKDRDISTVEEIRELIGAEAFSAISRYITLSLSPYYIIQSEGRISGSAVRQTIQAMVQIDETLPLGYESVSWQEQYY